MAFDEALRAKRDEVVRAFVREARAAFPTEATQKEANIVDHVPRILDELADALETGRTSLPPAKEVAEQHAQTRWQQGIDVRTLVREYAHLRASLLSVCGHPSAAELATIDSFFNASIADAVTEYVRIAETGAASLRADVERENERLRRLQLSLSLLSEAGAMLAESSADQRQTVDGLAALCVPRLADCCSVYLLEQSVPSYLAIAHAVPEKAALLRALYDRFPLPADSPHGFPATLRTGRPDLVTNATDDLYVEIAQSPAHLAALRALGPTSWIVVPMTVQGGAPFAMLALFNTESGRTFAAQDLEIAEELARTSWTGPRQLTALRSCAA